MCLSVCSGERVHRQVLHAEGVLRRSRLCPGTNGLCVSPRVGDVLLRVVSLRPELTLLHRGATAF